MSSALTSPAFRRLLTAQVISLTGTGLATVALGLLAYDLAGRDAGLVLGTVFAIKMVAYVALAPVVAALVHAWPARSVLVTADLVRVLAVVGLPFVTQVWQVYLLVFVLQAASAAHTPTYQAALPQVLPGERAYTQALSWSRVAEDLEMVAAPALAAVLLLVVPSSTLFVGTAAGFAVSAALIARVPLVRPRAAADEEAGTERPFAERVRRGAVLMARTPALRPVLALNVAVAAAGAFALVQSVVLAQATFGLGEDAAALLLAAVGAGSVAVALGLPRVLDRVPERRLMLTGGAVLTGATALVPVALGLDATAGLLTVALLWVLVGAGWSAGETPMGRILRRSVAADDLAPVFAAQFSLSHACWLVTYPLVGWLGTVLDLGTVALLCAALAALATATTAALWHEPARPDARTLPERADAVAQ